MFTCINGGDNPADILSTHWAMHKVYDTLKPLLFSSKNNGDPFNIEEEVEVEEEAEPANNSATNSTETPSSMVLPRGVTNVRLQPCGDGVTGKQSREDRLRLAKV